MFTRKERKEYSEEAKNALNEAFKEMRKNNMYALQDHTCCGSCGGADIDARHKTTLEKGKKIRSGYCFYHHQDTERMKDEGELYLAYGGLDENDGYATLMQGHKIVAILRKHGLKVEWDGNAFKRILVHMDAVALPEVKEA